MKQVLGLTLQVDQKVESSQIDVCTTDVKHPNKRLW